jgi:hypothetical protein
MWNKSNHKTYQCAGIKTLSLVNPIAVFFAGVFSALNYWNSRTKNFGRLSGIQIFSGNNHPRNKIGRGVCRICERRHTYFNIYAGKHISALVLAGKSGVMIVNCLSARMRCKKSVLVLSVTGSFH